MVLARIKSLLRNLFRGERKESELSAELQAHLDLLIEEKIHAGQIIAEARRAARIELGGIEQLKGHVREVRSGAWLRTLASDIRYSLRILRKNPGFAAVTVLTLALGVGANTAVFSIVNAVLFHPLPYKNPDRLVWAAFYSPKVGDFGYVLEADYELWSQQSWLFEGVAYDSAAQLTLTGEGEATPLRAALVSPNFLHVLGLEPRIGRNFLEEETGPEAPLVVLITDDLWRHRFSMDPNVIGRKITLDQNPYDIIGVLPQNFEFPSRGPQPSFLSPHFAGAAIVGFDGIYARLRPGISKAIAAKNVDALSKRRTGNPSQDWNQQDGQVRLVSLHDHITGDFHLMLLVLLGAVGFVLLIACANVANLQLARAFTREKEIAIRSALGAGRGRLVRQLLTESAVLGVLGGTAGLLLASWLVSLARNLGPRSIPYLGNARLDPRVLAFTFLLSLVAALLFGLAPAVLATIGKASNEPLKERGGAGGRFRRVQGVLTIVEIGVALLLFVCAGLLIRTLQNLTSLPLNFDPHHVITARVDLPYSLYREPKQILGFFSRATQQMRSLPGVTSVGQIWESAVPLRQGLSVEPITIEGRTPARVEDVPFAAYDEVTSGYFDTLRIPLVTGRFFSAQDMFESPKVALINQTFAQRYFKQANPLGKKLQMGSDIISPRRDQTSFVIVGVVADIKQQLAAPTKPQVYFPFSRISDPRATFLIRTSGNPLSLAAAIREQIAALDRLAPVTNVESMDQIVASAVAAQRFSALILSAFAALAILLAGVGIYGVMAYAVSQRTREIGVRMALGAESSNVLSMVLGEGLRLALAGVALGLAASFGLTRLMRGMLYGVTPFDPVTFCSVTVVLAAVALAACWIPARRAMRLHPLVALRHD